MPYGVADSLWAKLPPDDQAAIAATYQGLTPPAIGPYAPVLTPEAASSAPPQTLSADGTWTLTGSVMGVGPAPVAASVGPPPASTGRSLMSYDDGFDGIPVPIPVWKKKKKAQNLGPLTPINIPPVSSTSRKPGPTIITDPIPINWGHNTYHPPTVQQGPRITAHPIHVQGPRITSHPNHPPTSNLTSHPVAPPTKTLLNASKNDGKKGEDELALRRAKRDAADRARAEESEPDNIEDMIAKVKHDHDMTMAGLARLAKTPNRPNKVARGKAILAAMTRARIEGWKGSNEILAQRLKRIYHDEVGTADPWHIIDALLRQIMEPDEASEHAAWRKEHPVQPRRASALPPGAWDIAGRPIARTGTPVDNATLAWANKGYVEIPDARVTTKHINFVSNVSGRVAKEMGLGPEAEAGIRRAARLHDLAKIFDPYKNLTALQREFTPEERAIMGGHTEASVHIARGLKVTDSWVYDAIAHHGGSQAITTTIVAMVDAFDAASSPGRAPFSRFLTPGQALLDISLPRGLDGSGRGFHIDPNNPIQVEVFQNLQNVIHRTYGMSLNRRRTR